MTDRARDLPEFIDYRSIKQGLSEVDASLSEESPNDGLRSALRSFEYSDRERFKQWFDDLDDDVQDHLADRLIRSKKLSLLEEDIDNKKRYIEDSVAEDARGLADSLDLSTIQYYESFFTFGDRTSSLHSIDQVGGIFAKINENAETVEEAQDIFRENVRESETIDDLYAQAAGQYPSPIIGDIDYYPKPRTIRFTRPNRMYAEYWKKGEEITRFDVNRSDYMTITTRSRTAVRVNLEKGLIEFASQDNSDNHQKAVLDELVDNFAIEDGVETDGGLSLTQQEHSRVSISSSDVEQVNENIGIMSTLDSFRGRIANTSLHSIKQRPVDRDENHEELKERGYIKSHPRLLLGVKDDEYELLDPEEVYDDYAPDIEDDIPDMDTLVDEIRENSSYDSVERYTIVLNADENTFRIWKAAQKPSVRELVFNLVAEELNWGQ